MEQENTITIYKRLADAQAEFRNVEQTQQAAAFGSGRGYLFADINEVLAVVRPVLNRHGLAIVQNVSSPEGSRNVVSVETVIFSIDGDSIKSGVFSASTEGLQQKGVQALGSAITYLRRYQLMGLLGLAYGNNDDDDGRTAVESSEETVATKYNDADLTSTAMLEAEKGRAAFATFWSNRSREERASLMPHMETFKVAMKKADGGANA